MDKKTERITLWIPDDLKIDLMHLAAGGDRKLSEYIGTVLFCHVYGHRALQDAGCEGADSGDSPR
jgi:hypothetical protein